PGLPDMAAIRHVVAAVAPVPVNVLIGPRTGPVPLSELTDAGVKRVSLGGALYRQAMTAVVEAATRLTDGDLAATSVSSSAAGSDISLTTLNSGNILLGSVSAPDVVSIASAGTINDAAAADTLTDITAASVVMSSVGGMGATEGIELDVEIVDVSNTGGGAMALASSYAGTGFVDVSASNTGGNISFTQSGAQALVARNVSTTGSGDIAFVNTADSIAIFNIDSAGDAAITASAAGAEVQIGGAATAANTLNVTAAAEIYEVNASGSGGGAIDDGVADFVADTINLRVTGNGNIGIVSDPTRAVEIDAATVSAQVDGVTSGQINIENFRGDTAATTVTNLSLAAAGGIEYAQTGGSAVAFQNVTTTNGSIALVNDDANLVATGVAAAGAGSSVTLETTTSGTVSLGSVSAIGAVGITSIADVIESANNTTANITANSVSIAAQTGIGTTSNGAIDVNAPTISSLTTAAGGIDVRAQGQANVAFTSVDADAGNVTLTTDSGNMTATAVNADAGDVHLETVTSGNIVLGAVSATGSDVTAIAAGSISDNANDNIVDIASATATLSAQTGIGVGNGNIDLAVGVIDAASTATGGVNLRSTVATTFSSVTTTGAASNILIAGNGNTTITSASATDGNIDVDVASGNLAAGTLTATGATRDIFLDTVGSGNIIIGDVTAADIVSVTSAGTINDDTGGNDTNADLTGTTVTLSAVGGIGNTDRVEISATGLSATNNTSGDIVLGILGDVTLSGGIANNAAGGALDITAIGGDLNTGA
ncbi:MAG: isocitrate lyase/phosphoenolpyruvate mutase family protein, partial [Proteobacteria bacterium]|nr:isocitrate lyase/phosphoenolpyruvate mutase family protein [Pseudomonadota bacterium]